MEASDERRKRLRAWSKAAREHELQDFNTGQAMKPMHNPLADDEPSTSEAVRGQFEFYSDPLGSLEASHTAFQNHSWQKDGAVSGKSYSQQVPGYARSSGSRQQQEQQMWGNYLPTYGPRQPQPPWQPPLQQQWQLQQAVPPPFPPTMSWPQEHPHAHKNHWQYPRQPQPSKTAARSSSASNKPGMGLKGQSGQPIDLFVNDNMLENPWSELEKRMGLQSASKNTETARIQQDVGCTDKHNIQVEPEGRACAEGEIDRPWH